MNYALVKEGFVINASNKKISTLFSYICDSSHESQKEFIGEERDGYLYIYNEFDDPWLENPIVKIETEKLDKLFKQWKEVHAKRPKRVFISEEGGEFKFEGIDFAPRKIDQLDLKNLSFDKIDIFNQPDPKFEGGFHCLPKKEDRNFDITKKYCYKKCLSAADIKFKDDFIVNHSFFCQSLTTEQIKEQIIESINQGLGTTKDVEVKDKIFSFYGYANGEAILSIINHNGEILTAFRLIEENQNV